MDGNWRSCRDLQLRCENLSTRQRWGRSFISGVALGQQGGAQFVAVAGRSMPLPARRQRAGGSLGKHNCSK
ncbi:hypothetical protein ATANTOWER_005739 [Ataeniobius toweri]|uniref:Uncharacterized protein n=1 Tax=Ataeniobius toweri TaxID=208326 RepID=A0ABU7BR31_9TELE|nr:hypothetical protein [Ataeniobius toweri]